MLNYQIKKLYKTPYTTNPNTKFISISVDKKVKII